MYPLVIHQNLLGRFQHFFLIWWQRSRRLMPGCAESTGLANASSLYSPHMFAQARKAAWGTNLHSLDETVPQRAVVGVLLDMHRCWFGAGLIPAHPARGDILNAHDLLSGAQLMRFREYCFATAGSEFGFDLRRSFFYQAYRRVLPASAVSVYLSYPLMWSRSLLEAVFAVAG